MLTFEDIPGRVDGADLSYTPAMDARWKQELHDVAFAVDILEKSPLPERARRRNEGRRGWLSREPDLEILDEIDVPGKRTGPRRLHDIEGNGRGLRRVDDCPDIHGTPSPVGQLANDLRLLYGDHVGVFNTVRRDGQIAEFGTKEEVRVVAEQICVLLETNALDAESPSKAAGDRFLPAVDVVARSDGER